MTYSHTLQFIIFQKTIVRVTNSFMLSEISLESKKTDVNYKLRHPNWSNNSQVNRQTPVQRATNHIAPQMWSFRRAYRTISNVYINKSIQFQSDFLHSTEKHPSPLSTCPYIVPVNRRDSKNPSIYMPANLTTYLTHKHSLYLFSSHLKLYGKVFHRLSYAKCYYARSEGNTSGDKPIK